MTKELPQWEQVVPDNDQGWSIKFANISVDMVGCTTGWLVWTNPLLFKPIHLENTDFEDAKTMALTHAWAFIYRAATQGLREATQLSMNERAARHTGTPVEEINRRSDVALRNLRRDRQDELAPFDPGQVWFGLPREGL